MGRTRPGPIVAEPRGYTAGWYDYRERQVCLKSWAPDGGMEIERIPFVRYLYLNAEDYETLSCRELDRMFDKVEPVDTGRHVRCYADTRTREEWDAITKWFRDRDVEPLEGDVDPLSRYLADNPIRFAKPRILFYDIESDSRKGFVPGPRGMQPNPDSRILSVSWATSPEDVDVEVADALTDESESRVLGMFFQAVAKADVLVAWNGDAFDEILLRARAKALIRYTHSRPEWRMVNFLDLMLLFKHPYYGFGRDPEATGVKTSFSLANIAETALGESKVADVSGAKVYELWARDKAKLAEYNAQDTRLLAKLERSKGYIAGFEVISHTCNRFVSSRGIKAGNTGDGFMLAYGSRCGFRFGTKLDIEEKEEEEKFTGALVLEPKPGLHRDVCAVDFTALYPSLLRAFNIGLETKVCDPGKEPPTGVVFARAENGACFRTDEDSILSSIVATCTANRGPWKKKMAALKAAGKAATPEYAEARRMSDSWKVVQNALVGLMGSQYTRIYDRSCFEAVTITGRAVITKVAAMAEEAGLPVLYADTDSNYLRCTEAQAAQFVKDVAVSMDEWVLERGGRPGFIRLDLERPTYERIFWGRKADGKPAMKKYAGVKTDGSWDIKGMEIVRGDGCRYRREFQRVMIGYILTDMLPTVEGAERICREKAVEIYFGNVSPKDLAITAGLNRDPDEYKVDLPQIRVARKMIAAGREVFVGQKIPYVVVGLMAPAGKGKSSKPEVVHVDDYQGVYDAGYYWADQCYPAVMRLLMSVFPEAASMWKELAKWDPDSKQVSLFSPTRSTLIELMLSLLETDTDMEGLKRAMGRVPQGAGVSVVLDLPAGQRIKTGVLTPEPRAMVREAERFLGHRVYYGIDSDLGSR